MRGVGGSTTDRQPSASLVDEQVVDEHCRYVPAEPLRRYVAWYTGYRQRGMPPATHRGLPSPYLTLIFTLDEPLTIVAHPDPGQPPGGLAELDLPAETVLGGVCAELRDRVRSAAGWPERFAVLEEILLRQLLARGGA